jgi:hypothetical protein
MLLGIRTNYRWLTTGKLAIRACRSQSGSSPKGAASCVTGRMVRFRSLRTQARRCSCAAAQRFGEGLPIETDVPFDAVTGSDRTLRCESSYWERSLSPSKLRRPVTDRRSESFAEVLALLCPTQASLSRPLVGAVGPPGVPRRPVSCLRMHPLREALPPGATAPNETGCCSRLLVAASPRLKHSGYPWRRAPAWSSPFLLSLLNQVRARPMEYPCSPL